MTLTIHAIGGALSLGLLALAPAPEPEPITRTIDHEVSPAPDGRRIAFVSSRDGRFKLYVMNVDGSGLRRLTDDDHPDDNPSWSPDGRWIAFVSTRDGNPDIHLALFGTARSNAITACVCATAFCGIGGVPADHTGIRSDV